MSTEEKLRSIPQPPTKFLVGNLGDLDPENAIRSMTGLIHQYGDIVKLSLIGRELVIVGSQELVNEVCDQSRFKKIVKGALGEVRSVAGDGLFTAHGDEANWELAHRILMPAFGPLSIRNMLPGMIDIATQLVAKWHRFGDQRIDIVDDFTRLTLDTIALCTFSHRFNSFYSESAPPFVQAMSRSLKAAGLKTRRLPGTSWLYRATDQEFEEDVALQHSIADELVKERKDSGEDKGDLLDTMLKGRDPKTGAGLSSENIRYQLVTFLIAGHETTSGMLSFLFHYLLRDPRATAAIRKEVDTVCGSEPVKFEHLQKLKYIDAALKETLRLKSTAPAFTLAPIDKDEVIGGKYIIPKDTAVNVILDALHRDPAVWGDDAEDFKPERMMDGKFEALPPNAWKPFGNGMRGCIGRPFAWQESLLVVAMLFQNFDFRPHDANYQLEIKTSLTIKPGHLYMHVSPRKDVKIPVTLSSTATPQGPGPEQEEAEAATTDSSGPPLAIYYGSNAGTCKALAKKLSDAATRRGFAVTTKRLNDLTAGSVPTDRPLAIVTASYEGQPTDDANFFYEWLKTAPSDSAKGVRYGVFGCGHPDWAATYHAVPTTIDNRLQECGAERIVSRGEGNASAADLFDTLDEWKEAYLEKIAAPDMAKAGKASLRAVVNTQARQKMLNHGEIPSAKIISNEIITHSNQQTKRHIVMRLEEGACYRTGDYLSLLPITPVESVRRVLKRFDLHGDDLISLSGSGMSFLLPTEFPISAFDLFAGFVELAQPVSNKQVASLVPFARNDDDKAALERLSQSEVYEKEVAKTRLSLLDVLEEYERVEMPLGDFILALPPLRMRQYSISSSPLQDPLQVSLTIAVLKAQHISKKGMYLGTATNFLAHLEPGMRIRAGVRPSQQAFHPPSDPKVPIIMAGAGSGIAPFRAFCQERAIQKKSGREVGPAILFFGCHSKDQDALYDSEMAEWESQGVVSVRYAFSQAPQESKGAKHVQDRIYVDREEISALFRQGAKVFVCGSKPMALGITAMCEKIYGEITGKSDEESKEWFKSVQADRFATDVFG